MAELIDELTPLIPEKPVSEEERKSGYNLFYVEQEIDKLEIFAKNQHMETEEDSYDCICCFCENNTPRCSHSCCRTGVKCENFKRRIEKIIEPELPIEP